MAGGASRYCKDRPVNFAELEGEKARKKLKTRSLGYLLIMLALNLSKIKCITTCVCVCVNI